MDDELICNFRKCRKRLGSSFAWVTSCSHIFCDGDGTREFTNSLVCPACDTTLPSKYDIVRLDLRPTEQFKAVALCGFKPEIIMEICTRAIAFWNYQVHQEQTYQEHLASKTREKMTQLDQYYEHVVNRLQAELTTLKSQIASTKKKLDQYESKCKEMNAKLTEKNRQHIKLQGLYEALRRRCVTPASFNSGAPETADFRDPNPQAFMMNLFPRDDVLGPPGNSARGCHVTASDVHGTPRRSPPEREFTIRPNHTPLAGDVGSLHRFPADHHRDV
ncbi:E3 ubiquitin-protein ligase CCNB1IP1-like [Babylonia areolata]|uniref:E3 ubiquitin-protein ligase CCNB1IP1-like n=1 Tax=Babylonia areolata TaxID=304850 RepID=UPI003FD26335